jgi:hypothetical protein
MATPWLHSKDGTISQLLEEASSVLITAGTISQLPEGLLNPHYSRDGTPANCWKRAHMNKNPARASLS